MVESDPARRILWLEDAPKRPLCDVPWMGNTVVLANGDVNFCCFSDAVVGNVNRTPLADIWNNETMRRIRRSLREQELPPECRTPSCPILRGDENHIILTRMDGAYRRQLTGAADPHAAIRAGFEGSSIRPLPASSHGGPGIELEVELRYAGAPVRADLYLAVRGEDGPVRFLPHLETVPLPYRVGIRFPAEQPFSVRWSSESRDPRWRPARYDACAALFESGSHPNIGSNCYWFTTAFCGAEARPSEEPTASREVP